MTRSTRSGIWLAGLMCALALAACSAGPSDADIEATVNARLTAEAPPPAPPTPTPEPEAPASGDEPVLAPPTAQAGEPTLTSTIDLRVRNGPGTNYHIIGVLRTGTSARIVGKSPDGFWWKIECPPGLGSECWSSAAAQFGTAEDVEGVTVAAVPPPPPPTATSAATVVAQASATPTASATQPGQPTATSSATQPGQSTATHTPTASPTTQGQPTPTYTSTPSPTTQQTQPTATATSTPSQTHTASPSPTMPTAQEAPFDNDSLQNPAQSVFFSITGTRNFSHSNDVSYPGGDQDDWVAFEFPNSSNPNQNVWITLTCQIQGPPGAQLRATVYENGSATTKIVICNTDEQQLTVDNTKQQQLRIHWGITKDGIYATYTVTVVGFK